MAKRKRVFVDSQSQDDISLLKHAKLDDIARDSHLKDSPELHKLKESAHVPLTPLSATSKPEYGSRTNASTFDSSTSGDNTVPLGGSFDPVDKSASEDISSVVNDSHNSEALDLYPVEIVAVKKSLPLPLIDLKPKSRPEARLEVPPTPPVLANGSIKYKSILPGHEATGLISVPVNQPLYEFCEKLFNCDDYIILNSSTGVRVASYMMLSQLIPESDLKKPFNIEIMTKAQLRDLELTKLHQQSSDSDQEEVADEPNDGPNEKEAGDEEENNKEGYFTITVNFKDNRPLKLAVKSESKLERVIEYIKEKKPPAKNSPNPIRLLFDDEEMDLSKTIGDFDIEENDIIDVHF